MSTFHFIEEWRARYWSVRRLCIGLNFLTLESYFPIRNIFLSRKGMTNSSVFFNPQASPNLILQTGLVVSKRKYGPHTEVDICVLLPYNLQQANFVSLANCASVSFGVQGEWPRCRLNLPVEWILLACDHWPKLAPDQSLSGLLMTTRHETAQTGILVQKDVRTEMAATSFTC